MPRKKITRLDITPQTHVRSTQGDSVFFRIPEDKLRPDGLKRKRRLQKYNTYKGELLDVSREKRFIIPEFGAHITFFVPVFRSWSKKKKADLHLQPHQAKPDLDNFLKAFKDSIMREDKGVHSYTVSKKWVNQEDGYIEIQVK